MYVPALGLRHVNDQTIWDSPGFTPWPTDVGGLPTSCRFKNDNTIQGNLGVGIDGFLTIENQLNVDFCSVTFVGEIIASQGLLSGQPSHLEVAVLGEPVLGNLRFDALFATHPAQLQSFPGTKVSWLSDGLGIVAQKPGSLPPFHGHVGSAAAGLDAIIPGWPFYGDQDGNVNGFFTITFPFGRLAAPMLSISGYRRLFVEVRCRLGGNEDIEQMQLRGTIAASLFELPADLAGHRRG